MDDPEEEWGMEEYYPCSSGEDESESKVSWLWNRGLKLGKKVVMTGVVISSAPLFLPPLVVASALGFAVSVPFGVVFASYACTEKLMSKLLPMPVPSRLLEYESLLLEEEESEFGGEFLMEVVKEQTELRIELEEDGNKEQPEGENGLGEIEVVEGGKRYKDESGKDIGYEEDGGNLEGKDKGSLEGTDVKTEGLVEEVDKKPLNQESKNEKPSPEVKRVVVVVGEGKKNDNEVTNPGELVVVSRKAKSDIRDVQVLNSNEEHNKLKEGTTGLLEKIRDKGHTGESVKKHKKKHKHHHSKMSHGIVGQKEDKHGKNVDEKMNEHIKGDETVSDVKKTSTEEADEGLITKNVVTDDGSSVKSAGDQGTATNGSHAPVNHKVKPGTTIQESGVNSIAIDEKEIKSVGSNAARRETDGQYSFLVCRCFD